MNFRTNVFLIIIACLITTACGSPGVPIPPSLELPRPVSDLHALRKGDRVALTWTQPTLTTERRNLDRGGTVQVCRSTSTITKCQAPIASIPFRRPEARTKAPAQLETYSDLLPSTSSVTNGATDFFYAVNVLNPYGRSAGLSNQVRVPAAPALPPPRDFHAQLTAEGVNLSWQPTAPPPEIPGVRFLYRVYRRESGTHTDLIAGELPLSNDSQPGLADRGFDWEKTYDYRVTVVTVVGQANGTEQQFEGDDTAPVQIVAHDVFPPAAPTGLQAVFSGPGQKPFIDLVWAPNSEPDLAGYNVYRHEANAQSVKINQELIKSPAYRDANVTPGHEYIYSASAVDVRGNESPHSEEASESVP